MHINYIDIKRFDTNQYISPELFEDLSRDSSIRKEVQILGETIETITDYVTRIQAGELPVVKIIGPVDTDGRDIDGRPTGRLTIIDSSEAVTAYAYCGKTSIPCEFLDGSDFQIPTYMRMSN